MPKPRSAAIPKLSRPRVSQIAQRDRLFEAVDQARSHAALWIDAAPGSGKTTLLASYLEARAQDGIWYQVDDDDDDPATFFHYLSLAAETGAHAKPAQLPRFPTEGRIDTAAFSRRYFRTLFALLPNDGIIVFDNYQEAADSALDTILRQAIEETPAGLLVVVLSLTPPPSTLARLVATQAVVRFDADRLRFTPDEARAVASRYAAVDPSIVASLYEQSGGWAAGFVLMLEHQRIAFSADHGPARDVPSSVFDYFAGEIFARTPPEHQRILMITSLVPGVTAKLASALTHDEAVEPLLEALASRHLFTNRTGAAEPTYHFHGLFRAFLVARARAHFSDAERNDLTLRASRVLEAEGRLEDAIGVALQWSHHDAAAAMILRCADTLFQQGRRHLLSDWIKALPDAVLDREPWLAYWLGAGDVFVDAAGARLHLERAYDRFVERNDVAGQIISAGAITRAFIHDISWVGLDRWLVVLDLLLSAPCEDVPRSVELGGLSRALYVTVIRTPKHPHAQQWADRAMTMLGGDIDANEVAMAAFSLMTHFNWYGGNAAQERIIGWVQPLATEGKLNAVSLTYWNWVFSNYLLNVRASEDSLRAMDRAIEIAATHALLITAVLRQYRVGVLLSLGKVSEAAATMAELDDVGHALPRVEPYNEIKSWLALVQGDLPRAEAYARAALQIASDRGRTIYRLMDLFVLAETQIEARMHDQARETIAEYRRSTDGVAGFLPAYQASLLEAYLALKETRSGACHAVLRSALAVGRREGIANHWMWYPRMMSRLYAEALEQGIEVDYVRDVIQRRGLMAEAPYPIHWPWPLRVRTLGSFEVLHHGTPLVWEGKAQRKPLELLKALIALGGRDVPADKLIGLIWPAQVDGQKAFEMAIHRLRKLLDAPDGIKVTDRRATLNPQIVFVDLWALEHELAAVIPPANAPEPDIGLLETAAVRIMELYRGPFLPGEPEDPWLVAIRNRLAGRFERFVHRLGAHWEAQQRWEEAASLYARAIELEPLAETFYRRRMVCLHTQGRRAEAIEVFRRCRQLLSIVLGIKPSAETEATYAQIAAETPTDAGRT